MSFDLEKILESKAAFRRELAALPIEEKLRLLDAIRERELLLRSAASPSPVGGASPAKRADSNHRKSV